MKRSSRTVGLLAGVVTFSVSACGGTSEVPSNSASSAPPSASSSPTELSSSNAVPSKSSEEVTPSYPQQEEQAHYSVGKSTFEYFTVELKEAPKNVQVIDGLIGQYVKTCVNKLPEEFKDKGKIPVLLSSWTSTVLPSGEALERVTHGGYQPEYPEQTDLGVGECVEGFLSAKRTEDEVDGDKLIYENDLGERSVWSYD